MPQTACDAAALPDLPAARGAEVGQTAPGIPLRLENGHMRLGAPDGSGFSWRLSRLGWIYVLAVASLATVSAITASLTAYLILLVVTLPSGVAAQIANLTLVFGLAGIFSLEPDGNYPLLGAVTVT